MLYKVIDTRFPFKDKIFDDKEGENYVGSPKMKAIQRRLKYAKVNFRCEVWG